MDFQVNDTLGNANGYEAVILKVNGSRQKD